MTDLLKKTAMVIDHGLFTFIAERLAEDFGRVLYFNPWATAFPKSGPHMVGEGIDGVERIDEIWSNLDRADIIIFPDIYDGELQNHLRKLGHRVWGGGTTDHFEYDRWEFRNLQADIKMATPRCERLRGLTALRDLLIENEDLYVKVNKYRGDMESFHHTSYNLTEPYLDDLESRLGAKKEVIEFVVEWPVEGVEVGFDGWSIDGKFPEIAGYGYEIKDNGYVGRIVKYADLPDSLKRVNDKLAPELLKNGMRGFM